MKRVLVMVAFAALLPAAALAQEPAEPLLTELEQRFKTRPLSVGALLQVVGDVAGERVGSRNGFSIANMRVSLRGDLDEGFGYFLQANFINSPALLDARMSWTASPALRFDAGRFKTPFSAEFLTGAAAIDFVNRSRVVSTLVPGRQLGVQVGGRTTSSFGYRAGVFSGPSDRSRAESVLAAGRVDFMTPAAAATRLMVGINAAAGENQGILDIVDFSPPHTGQLFGADARLTHGRLLLAGEYIHGWLDSELEGKRATSGFHLTGGVMTSRRTQLLARWDHFAALAAEADDLLIVGLNIWPTRATEVQANYIAPVNSDAQGHQLLVNLQVGF